jgi:hypothetical protein
VDWSVCGLPAAGFDQEQVKYRESESGAGIRGSDLAQDMAHDALAAEIVPEFGHGEPRGGIASQLVARELAKVAPQEDGADQGKKRGGARPA